LQVTFFKCGGVALGTALHHAAIDAISAFHFLQTWSAFSRDGERAIVEPPSHDRTLLRGRSPPTIHSNALSTFYPELAFSDPSGPVASEVFAISKDQVASLKRLCDGASTFCAVSALVWRCACVARRLPPDSKSHLTFPVNIRRRVRPSLPERYFGNAVVKAVAAAAVQDIKSKALASIADRIRGAIGRVDDELVRSAIDYYEMAGMDNLSSAKGTLPETVLNGTSWLGMPIYDADFGWGKPRVMSRAESNRGGFFYLMNNEKADAAGGVRVLMCMEVANMKEMERLLYEALA
jgi:shikimate O-hydroxycinnamoyltransferase